MTSLSGTNSIPLAAGGTASVPSAANNISPHTASYLATGSSLTAQGTHIPAAAYHISHGNAATSQPTLAALPSQHSQGPTPASTPPTVPNETKGPGQYQNYTHTMNQHPLTYGRIHQTGVIINNNATRNQHPGRLQQIPRYIPPLATGTHMGYSINMLQSAALPTSSASAANIIPNPNYQLPGSAGSEHGVLYMPTAPYSTYFNSSAVRGGWSTTAARAPAQNVVQVGQTNTIIPASQPYLGMNSVTSMPQQPPQQQHTPATGTTKTRSFALKIINPDTGREVDPNSSDGEESAKPDKKDAAPGDVKRVSESSATTSTLTFSGKEPNQSVLNGTAPSTPYVPTTKDWKATSQTGATANSFGQIDAAPSSMKPANVPTSIQSAKMDYKKPTREEHPAGDTQPGADSKLRDKQTTSSWPETSSVPPTIAATAQGSAPLGAKKSSKEAENAALNSSTTSASTAVTPTTTTTILTSTVPSDGASKTIVTTSTTVVLNDSETGSKKTTKQGIPGGIVGGVPKDSIPSVKHAMGKPHALAAASQSLPETTQTLASIVGGPLSAAQSSASVTKSDFKSQSSVQHPTAQLASGTAAIPGVKPPATAMPTSGPISEKMSPVPASLPNEAKLAAAASVVSSPVTTVTAEKASSSLSASSSMSTVKDEKPSPSTKPKNRGKDQSSDSNANDHSGSNAKGKSAQPSVPTKHHGTDVASKPVSSTSSGSTATKQTNGEAAEQNATLEGKTKKKKGSSKKELNKKGQEKEGSDMDIFTKIEQTTTLPEKGVRVEKAPQPNSQPLAVNANTNNRSKINSSQKSENISSVNSLDAKEKVIDSQNIPNASTVPAQLPDTNKTENDKPVDNTILGKKKYTVQFMLSIRELPQCNVAVKVNYMPPPQGGSNLRGMSQNGYAAGGACFLPSFMSQGNSSSLAPRKSQQGSMRRDKPNQIHVSLSLREEVPLRRSKDAWKPAIFTNDSKNVNDEEKKTELLYKTARGILNKLTPEKFSVLLEKFKKLEIDSRERLEGVIDLIFEKAVDEPGFCKWYAEMCSVMQNISVPADDADSKQPSFRSILLNKCQNHFESAKAEELYADKKRAEINACTDPEKKKELLMVVAENERKARRKSVGNCRFIGELFKLKMLTPRIMLNCIRILISQLEEESLECLCKLLTTIGKEIDEKLPKELDTIFKRLQEIADPKKTPKISSRIRFMIQDVIDLRKNRWVPRRETDNPKTIDQMNMEMEKKEQEQKLANMTVRKSYDDYSNRSKDSRRGNRNDNQQDDSWKTVTGKNNASKLNYKYDAQKIANITAAAAMDQEEGISLGRPSSLSMWRQGSNFLKQPEKKSVTPSPMGERMDSSRSSSVTSSRNASGGKLTPSTSLERSKQNLPPRDDDTNKMSRSGSVQSVRSQSRESSVPRAPPSRNASQTASTPSPSISPLPDDKVEKFSKTIFEEFIVTQSIQDTVIDFTERFKTKEDKQRAVKSFIEQVLEKPKHNLTCGKMVSGLLDAKVLSIPTLVEATSTILNAADDLMYDYPKFWDYMTDLVCSWPLQNEDCKLFNELKTVLQRLAQEKGCTVMLPRMEKMIRNDKERISEYFSRALGTEESDSVFKWINENVENPNNNPNLVIALTKAVCKAVLEKKSLPSEDVQLLIKEKYGVYFKKYIDNKKQLELECLNTIVDFSRRKEHPKGLLLNMFEGLYDSKALSVDSFMELKKSQSEEIGVVMMNVKNFYDYLKHQSEERP